MEKNPESRVMLMKHGMSDAINPFSDSVSNHYIVNFLCLTQKAKVPAMARVASAILTGIIIKIQ